MNNRTLSIVMGVIIIFVVALGAYVLGASTKNTISPLSTSGQKISGTMTAHISPTKVVTYTPGQSPKEVTENFYKTYEDCLKNPPIEAAGQVSIYCQNNTNYTTKDFTSNITAGGTASAGADPIFCSQNPLQNVKVDKVSQVQNSKTTATVIASYGAGTDVQIPVELLIEDMKWKVNSIVCPKP